MSLPQADRKAGTPEEIASLRQKIENMGELLGVPTCVLRFDDYFKDDYEQMRRAIKAKLHSFSEQDKEFSDYTRARLRGRSISSRISGNMVGMNGGRGFGFAHPIHHPRYGLMAHNYRFDEDYKTPEANIIQVSKESISGQQYIQQGLRVHTSSFAQEKPEEMKLYVLLHEAGHGVGAGEPQAETIAAVMFSKLLSNTAFLSEWADMRMLDTVLRYNLKNKDELNVDKYGLPMCEVNDYIRFLPPEDIDALTESDIIQTRFHTFNHQRNAVWQVGSMLKEMAADAFARRDLDQLSRQAEDILQKDSLDENSSYVMKRFILACERLKPTSTKGADIDPEILMSERSEPITFSKDYSLKNSDTTQNTEHLSAPEC